MKNDQQMAQESVEAFKPLAAMGAKPVDGGPAFPITHEGQHGGMTIRDEFAKAAMQGVLSKNGTTIQLPDGKFESLHCGRSIHQQLIAENAYQMADAMIAARNK